MFLRLQTPVLFLIFNRLDVAKRVFSEIRKAQPKQLFIAADGGRTAEEHLICTKIRQSILDMIDWECEVHTNFREENAGCGKNVSEAITWFFEHVEEGIILEDDCLPSQDFFHFCESLLEYYRNDIEIFSIGGSNFLCDQSTKKSYYFSHFCHIWGWATWKRTWDKYKIDLSNISREHLEIRLIEKFSDNQINSYILHLFDEILKGKIDTWDYQLWFTQLTEEKSVSIVPGVNLVSNIGFNAEATHTKNENTQITKRKLDRIETLNHPSSKKVFIKGDLYTFYESGLIFQFPNKSKIEHSNTMKLIGLVKLFFASGIKFQKIRRDIPISFKSFLKLRLNKKPDIFFNQNKIEYTSPFWFLHSLEEIFIEKSYLFEPQITSPPFIIDCGSNIGLAAIFWHNHFPNAKILCFEPDNEIFKLLKSNTKHIPIDCISIENIAVWIEDTELAFHSDGNLGGKLSDKESSEKVKAIQLKKILNQRVDFLKIDIEGAEYEVLKDCQDNLHYVENIFIEYHSSPNEPQKLQEILTILQNAGFRYYMKEAWPNRINPFIEKNSASSVYDLQLNIFGYRINEPS